jgi:insecticidal toxin complex protein TccC
VSERLGLHLVPPTKAKAKSMIQQDITNSRSNTQARRTLPDEARLFYYLINEFDDNSGNQLWDSRGNVFLIDHEAAFSEKKMRLTTYQRLIFQKRSMRSVGSSSKQSAVRTGKR